jgi:hypothetical protein
MGCLVDGLSHGYDVLGLAAATGGDQVFRQLVLARIIEPVSKLDSLRVLEEAGVDPDLAGMDIRLTSLISHSGGPPRRNGHEWSLLNGND